MEWSGRLSREVFSGGALSELGSDLSLFEIRTHASEIASRFTGSRDVEPQPEEAATGIDIGATTRDFIARRLRSDFKGVPLEHLVADLFRAMGYHTRTTRAAGDGGIDVVAHHDELGIEPPILKIQVKARDAHVGADVVKAFSAMVHERDVGIFMTTGGFTQAATEFAGSRSNLRLMDGTTLIDLIQKFYDHLDARYRQMIPLRKVLIPDLTTQEI